MKVIKKILDFFLHLDTHLFSMIIDYGPWVYVIFFAFIFIETGLVIMPFLPGDSLLFAAGTFCAGVENQFGETAQLNIWVVLIVLFSAAVLGDSLNYYLGKTIGLKVLGWKIGSKNLVSEKNIEKTRSFYKKHGAKTIIIARFVPIVRTFAPFVAGIGNMNYRKFILFNVLGAMFWVLLLVFTGYFFGNIPIIKNNFEIAILIIIAVSLLPMLFGYLKNQRKQP